MTIRRPMLAAKVTDLASVKYPVLASPKLDGIRCVMVDGQALTRKLKPVPNKHVRAWLEANCPDGWDGELMLPAPATFQHISSTFMSVNKIPPEDWYFAVFDWMPPLSEGAAQGPAVRKGAIVATRSAIWRERDLRTVPITGDVRGHVQIVPQLVIDSEPELQAFEEKCLAEGYEGVMLRAPGGPYKHGRSTLNEGWLLKLKRFEDSEAVVVGVVERMHNENPAEVNELGLTKRSHAKAGMHGNGALGALQVRDLSTGVEFEIGSGFTEIQRVHFWKHQRSVLGKVCKYKHFAQTGVKDKPRFPVWLGWRAAEDMD